jgi:hypothetical protein
VKLENVKVGDTLTRLLGGTLPMEVVVTIVNENEIVCGSPDGFVQGTAEDGWRFNRANGAEIDDDLGWVE